LLLPENLGELEEGGVDEDGEGVLLQQPREPHDGLALLSDPRRSQPCQIEIFYIILTNVTNPDPGSGMGKKSRSESGMTIPDHNFKSLKTIVWVKILKFFNADPDPGILDPGSGMGKIRIRDKHPDPKTLILTCDSKSNSKIRTLGNVKK
jgi:hypothetical protein